MINIECRGTVGLVEIDRHERRNALDIEHCARLRDAVTAVAANGARTVVITGAGTAFCAGADLGGVYGDEFREVLYGALHAIADLPIPVIAAVNGPAIGAGTQLAIACDLRVGSRAARFAVPTARNGLAVDPWTIRRLALIAGGGAARAMLIGCEEIDVAVALQRGLVDRTGDLDDAMVWAEDIATLSPQSLAYSKRVLDAAGDPMAEDCDLRDAFDACWHGEDGAEGRRARAEGRAPRFAPGGGAAT